MISDLETEESLRLLAKYYPVYQILWYGPIDLSGIKKQLMENYEMAESTARSYVNAIYDDKAGPLFLDEDGTVKMDRDQIIEIEEAMESLFRWDEYDYRHDQLKKEHEKCINLDLKCQDYSHIADQAIADKKKIERELNEKIAYLELQLKEKDAEIDGKEKELSECQEALGETLRMRTWKFFLYRIAFRLFDGERRLQEEGL